MTNEAFLLMSEESRSAKLRAVLMRKTEGCLTEQELQNILSHISSKRQYQVSVCNEKSVFLQLLKDVQGSGKIICSQEDVQNKNRQMLEEDRMVAVILQKQSEETGMNQISIYIPKTRFQKGKCHE